MIDVVIYDVVPRAGVIDLGKQVEGLVTRVVLPNIRRGAGTVQLVHQRSDDQKPYLVPITEDGESVYWLVSRSDTAFPGRGQAELQWLGENGAVAKSVTYQTNTTRSMAEPGPEPDEPLRPYTQAVARDAQAAKNAAASATEAARSAEASAGQAGLSAATAVEAARNAEAIVGQAGQSAQSAQAAALAAAQNAAAAETAKAGAKQAQTWAEAAKAEAQTAKTAAEKAAQEAKAAQAGAVEAKTGAETAQAKAEEAAQGVAADREQIGANTAGLEAAQQDVTVLKAENTTLKAVTDRTARSLDYLWKKSKGIVYDTETVTGAGSSVTVPSGAMDYAALRKLGGMSRKGRNLLDITRYTAATKPSDRITTKVDPNAIIFNVPVISESWQALRITLSDIGSGTYVVTANIDSTDADFTPSIGIYADNGDTVTAIGGLTASGAKTVTIPDGSVMRLYFHATTGNGATVARTVRYTNVMISKIAAAYEPYTDSLLDAPVDAVRVQGRNLLNPQIDGKAININTGLPATDARMCITDFIPVTPGDTYGMYSDFGNLGKLNVACYDATMAYTGKYPVANLVGFQAFTIPAGTAYIRCCILMTGKKTSYLYRGVSAGTAEDYTPYYQDTYPIPQAIRDLCPDYGIGVSADCYNYIDFAAKQYHHRVGQVDLGTPKFKKQDTTNGNWRFQASFNVMLLDTTNILSAKYPFVGNKTWSGVFGCSTNANQIQFCDMAYTTAVDFMAAVAGQILYYELATSEVIDLSAVWPDDDFGVLRVEAGGTINLHYPALDDGFELAVPSETEIMVDVAKVVETDG